ncbi:hypothetical protein ABIC03_003218 [Bradyrhizobium sp. RT6a]|jgi:hypothetical protein
MSSSRLWCQWQLAAVTPPAITLLLSTSFTSDAIAKSGASVVHHHGNNDWVTAAAIGTPNGKDDRGR